MQAAASPPRGPDGVRRPTAILRLLAGGLLGVATALLVSCAGSGKGLIPSAQAGPLKDDFNLVEAAAKAGHGNCAATESAIQKTESDFAGLPSSIDPGLRRRLRDGIAKLREDALELCAQALTQSTTPTTAPRTTTTTQTTATTPTTPPTTSSTQSTPSTTTTTTNPSGGTPAKEPEEPEPGRGRGNGNGGGHGREPGGAPPGGEG